MKITLKNLEIHNFFSFTEAYVSLNVPGYIMVKGENDNVEDNASSNGSGKSAIFEAILFCLTGETQRGVSNKSIIKQGVDNCSVTLTFSMDGDEYVVTRSLSPSQSLTIIKNGDDISGKGVKDSIAILKEQFPDLTMQLLSNIVIFGQGLPNRFSLNSPSGRKEVLEKLFKADFMIEDIKNRINDRLSDLKDEKRVFEDSVLSLSTRKSVFEDNKAKAQFELGNMTDVSTLSFSLGTLNTEISNLQNEIRTISEANKSIINDNDTINNKIIELTQKKVEINSSEYLSAEIEEIKEKGIALKNEVTVLDKEIANKDSITDTCPTCGQKLVGVEKPDTSVDKAKSMEMKKELDTLREQLKSLQAQRATKLNTDLQEVENEINTLKASLKTVADTSSLERKLNDKITERDNIKFNIDAFENKKKELENTIITATTEIEHIDKEIASTSTDKLKLESKIEVDNKINSIIKRDFRGYLLSNIINLIDSTAKEFAKEIFNHTKLNITQDGNNISITLNNKEYELLSGGEKQRTDLCCQLAIREVLIKYSGFNCPMLVMDEIFDNLDEISAERVLNLITNKLDIPSIFVITHHSDIPVPYDSEIIVKKNSFGSTVIQA